MSMNAIESASSWHIETSAAPWIKLQNVQWSRSWAIGRLPAGTLAWAVPRSDGFSGTVGWPKLLQMRAWSAQFALPVHALLPLGFAVLAPLILVSVVMPLSRLRGRGI